MTTAPVRSTPSVVRDVRPGPARLPPPERPHSVASRLLFLHPEWCNSGQHGPLARSKAGLPEPFVVSPRHVAEASEAGIPAWQDSRAQTWTGGQWVNEPPAGYDVGEALHVLQAIRILQRWVTAHPLGADALYLTSTSLTLTDGEHVVATIPIPDT